MATTYGGEVGIDSNAMVLALLLTQFVAFPCSILSGTLAKKFGSMRMIKIFIVMYMAICLFGYGLDTELEFWILAVSVGICQGGIQALSRSYYGKIKKDSHPGANVKRKPPAMAMTKKIVKIFFFIFS